MIVPTLDEELRIDVCLRSIGRHPEVEIVVSDGGSTDNTLDIVAAQRPDAVVVRGQRGRGGQLNRGAATATADRMLFLHADCVLPDGWFDPLTAAIDDDPSSLVCFRLHTEPIDGHRPGRWRRWWLSLFDLRSRGWGIPYGDQGYALSREFFETVGGFPDIPLMEDFAFARGCRRHGRISRLPLVVRTTARRFEGSPLKSRVILATFPTLFRLGVNPEVLARWYGVVR